MVCKLLILGRKQFHSDRLLDPDKSLRGSRLSTLLARAPNLLPLRVAGVLQKEPKYDERRHTVFDHQHMCLGMHNLRDSLHWPEDRHVLPTLGFPLRMKNA